MLLLQKYKISGHSMEPFLKNGDLVLVTGLIYIFKNPKINDIVAFRVSSGKVLIKRIREIKNGLFFVSGDNKKDSLDSKDFGLISKKSIIGKLIYKL
jgi:nickel-type superoxide dismutase maturation protease